MRKQKGSVCLGDTVFTAVNGSFLLLALILILYPLVYIVSSSVSSASAVASGRVWLWPVEPTLAGYRAVFQNNSVIVGYGNSLFYAVLGTLVQIAITVMVAYPLSRKDFYGRKVLMFLFTFTMLFSGGLVPYYILVKNLGGVDQRWAMILPGAVAVYQIIVTRTCFQTSIPGELLEASELDGCSDIRFMLSVLLPLSRPILAVLALWFAVGHWNSYFNALIFLQSPEKYPLQLVLRSILVRNEINPSMLMDPNKMQEIAEIRDLLKYSLIVVASLPVLLIYPFAQKYFVQGVMIGSIKD